MNPALGVPGFPDCQIDGDAVAAGAAPELALSCAQKPKDFGERAQARLGQRARGAGQVARVRAQQQAELQRLYDRARC